MTNRNHDSRREECQQSGERIIREWKTSASYPLGRIAEFVAVVKSEMLVSINDIVDYVVESEHQDEKVWIRDCKHLSDLIDDFKLYVKEVRNDQTT